MNLLFARPRRLAWRGLIITTFLYGILLVSLIFTVGVGAQQSKKVSVPPPDMGTLFYRVDQLEEWRRQRDAERLSQRVEVLETTNKIDRDNRALLWGLIGSAGLNILATAFLGFITTRKRT
jgi:hypothetical protein